MPENTKLQQINENLQGELSECEQKLIQIFDNNNGTKDSISYLEKTYYKYRQVMGIINYQNDETQTNQSEADLELLNQAYEDFYKEAQQKDEVISELNDHKRSNMKKIKELQDNIVKSTNILCQKNQEIKSVNNQISDYEENNRQIFQENDYMIKNNYKYEQENNSLRMQLEEAIQIFDESQQRYQEINLKQKHQISDLHAENEMLNKQIDQQLNYQVQIQNQSVLDQMLSQMKDQVSRKSIQNQQINSEIYELQLQNQTKNDKIQKLQLQILKYRDQLELIFDRLKKDEPETYQKAQRASFQLDININ